MKKTLLRSFVGISLIAALLSAALVFTVFYFQLYNELKDGVRDDVLSLKSAVSVCGESELKTLANSDGAYRVTLINSDGTVLFDNVADPSQMENHLNRPEVKSALTSGNGESSRVSATIGEHTFYHALRLDDGKILRVSRTTDSLWQAMYHCIPWTLFSILVVTIFSVLLARSRTRRIVEPINSLSLEKPLENNVYEELSPLLLRMEQQYRQIKATISELRRHQDEFAAITAHMREGLVVLNRKGTILSMNESAALLFEGADQNYVGENILKLNRSIPIQQVLNQAVSGKPAEANLSKHGGEYQIIGSPVLSDGQVDGAVLLVLDVTERLVSEQMRKEFTANVSHELKTPLQSISGYAEIMKDGLVKKEDMPRFINQIYMESQRLIALVEDILRLSRLDEVSNEFECEELDLLSLALETAERLTPIALRENVTLTVLGEESIVFGSPQLLTEIVYNLCDNAIKHNRVGGRVDVTVHQKDDETILVVSDTGIGIPKEHQRRIFERFYRVDKSHSKETGGTGLGLSIVKHAALYHHATIELDSKAGAGTKITVHFPANHAISS
jgi:two-component system phosphate regulon sensor histidine kinase PhoR